MRHAEAVSLGNPGPGEAAARCLPKGNSQTQLERAAAVLRSH
jgi:hypothetical protein